jgi:hypothetical protein
MSYLISPLCSIQKEGKDFLVLQKLQIFIEQRYRLKRPPQSRNWDRER